MFSKIERCVEKHIYPKIEETADKGEYFLAFSCSRRYSSYITIIQSLLQKEDFHVERSISFMRTIYISW